MTQLRALLLAGSRAGERDPVALAAGVPHKALVTVGGMPMIERVAACLARTPAIGAIIVVSEIGERLAALPTLAALARAGRLVMRESGPSPSLSVMAAFGEGGPPMLVTTADHALLDAVMVSEFLDLAGRRDADVAFAVVEQRRIVAAFPESRRTYLRFRDTAVSGANLFLLRTPAAAAAIRFWSKVEAERKRPWRLAAAFGLPLLLGYLLRRFSLEEACSRAGSRLGVRLAPVLLSRPEAAIDVDRLEDLLLVRRLLAARSSGEHGP